MELWNNTRGGVTVTVKIPIYFKIPRQDESPDSGNGTFTETTYRVDQ